MHLAFEELSGQGFLMNRGFDAIQFASLDFKKWLLFLAGNHFAVPDHAVQCQAEITVKEPRQ